MNFLWFVKINFLLMINYSAEAISLGKDCTQDANFPFSAALGFDYIPFSPCRTRNYNLSEDEFRSLEATPSILKARHTEKYDELRNEYRKTLKTVYKFYHKNSFGFFKQNGWYENILGNDTEYFHRSCSADNNEVCAPGPGDVVMTLEKKCLIFTPNTNQKLLQGLLLKTATEYINVPLVKFTCRCGYYTVNLTGLDAPRNLPLLAHPDTQKCVGPIGFPCKSYPIYGDPHEACITGFCDMESDSCEYEWDVPDYSYLNRAGVSLYHMGTYYELQIAYFFVLMASSLNSLHLLSILGFS